MTKHKIYTMSFSSIYTLYLANIEKKNRTKKELDTVFFGLQVIAKKNYNII